MSIAEPKQKLRLENLAFIDLKKQQQYIQPQIEEALQKVLKHGNYILGQEVTELEKNLSAFCGAKHSISCASGTDALHLILRAKDIGPGDVVFTPSFTFAATAEAVSLVGATPFFIDVLPDTFNLDPQSLLDGIKQAREKKLNPKCVITVDLFGAPVDYDVINKIAAENNLWVLADSAQSFGGKYKSRSVGTLGLATATSFFPAKPLGCYGDGGCVFTDNDELAEVLKSLRVHGKGQDKYDNVRIGLNSRLDTIQAAILIEKLKQFPKELEHRQKVAGKYNQLLSTIVQTPVIDNNYYSAWAQYTIVLPEEVNRSDFMANLAKEGVPSMIYYGKPLHLQAAYKHYLKLANGLPVTEKLMDKVVSFPMDGYIALETVETICEIVAESI
ncbi:MAG: DegT/DnrJ/EryC1/StrS family aminotransferase [Gammaproteobacteria bacterium]|nr:DegT/DnrJ/EryC1/StrS family aminotransferase [Gammaproteobacteria bacterium]